MNCLSPQFSRAFELDYYFEEVQQLRFAVYDIDNKTPQVSDDDFLGEIECTLGEVRFHLCLSAYSDGTSVIDYILTV